MKTLPRHYNPNFQVVTYLVEKELVNKQGNHGRTALDLIRSDPTNEAIRNFLSESSQYKKLPIVVITILI